VKPTGGKNAANETSIWRQICRHIIYSQINPSSNFQRPISAMMSIVNQFKKSTKRKMGDSSINYEAIDPIKINAVDCWPQAGTYPPFAGGYASLLGALWLDCTKEALVNLADDFVLIASVPGVDDATAGRCLSLGQAMADAWVEDTDGILAGLPKEFQLTDDMRKFYRPRLKQCTHSRYLV
jgi:hypothetical protein